MMKSEQLQATRLRLAEAESNLENLKAERQRLTDQIEGRVRADGIGDSTYTNSQQDKDEKRLSDSVRDIARAERTLESLKSACEELFEQGKAEREEQLRLNLREINLRAIGSLQQLLQGWQLVCDCKVDLERQRQEAVVFWQAYWDGENPPKTQFASRQEEADAFAERARDERDMQGRVQTAVNINGLLNALEEEVHYVRDVKRKVPSPCQFLTEGGCKLLRPTATSVEEASDEN
jgi:hypothetical protein